VVALPAGCRGPAPPAEGLALPAVPVSVGPLTFFEDRCARCHGAGGSLYALPFKAAGDRELRAEVARMVTGPARAWLDPATLEALTAFHRSIRDRRPFVAVLVPGPGMRGEATPGAAVRARIDGAWFEATRADVAWEIPGSSAPRHEAVVEATLDGRTTRLDLSTGWYSHR
jgi:hypothetical protein